MLFCFCVVETGGDGDQRDRKGDSGGAEQTGEGEEEGGGRHRTGREEIFRGGRWFRGGGGRRALLPQGFDLLPTQRVPHLYYFGAVVLCSTAATVTLES